MRVEQIMHREVITVGLDARVDTVRKLFEKHKFHHLLVVEKNKLVGIVSDRDILKQLSPFLSTASELNRLSPALLPNLTEDHPEAGASLPWNTN